MAMPIEIRHVTPALAVVSGYGSREVVTAVRRGRVPTWSRAERGWVVQPSTAADLLAYLEQRGRHVVVTGNVPQVAWSSSSVPDDEDNRGDGLAEAAGLW